MIYVTYVVIFLTGCKLNITAQKNSKQKRKKTNTSDSLVNQTDDIDTTIVQRHRTVNNYRDYAENQKTPKTNNNDSHNKTTLIMTTT